MFKLSIKELKEIIATLSKADTKGIGQNLQIIADNNSVEFIAGFEPQIRKTIELETVEPGSVTINFDQLKKIVSKLKNDVTFELLDTLKLTSGKITLQIDKLESVYPGLTYKEVFKVETTEFINKLKTVSHSVSKQASRPILQALHMDIKDGKLILTSTDAHRLSRNELDLMLLNDGNDYNFNPCGQSLKKLSTLKGMGDHLIFNLTDDSEYIVIDDLKGTRMVIKNIQGNYPDTDRLLGISHNTTLNVSVTDLLESLDVIEIVVKNAEHYRATFKLNEQSQLVARNDSGMLTEIEMPNHEGENLIIAFNPTYLKEALQTYSKDDQVKIIFSSSLRPFQIHKNNNIQLITPIRTGGA